MTVETLISTSLEQVKTVSPDSSLAAAQFEAIIRAWKGETVEGTVPASPVGEADWDGSIGLGQLDPSKLAPAAMCDYLSLLDLTWLCPTFDCSYVCTIDPPTCFPSCQYG